MEGLRDRAKKDRKGFLPVKVDFQWKVVLFGRETLGYLSDATVRQSFKVPITSTHFSTLFIFRNRPKYIVLFLEPLD